MRKPKSASEAAGETWVQSSGSPENRTVEERDAGLTEARVARRTIGVTCPQCGATLGEHQWGYRCERPSCRTVLGDEHSGRLVPGATKPVYRCIQCGELTEDRYATGDGYFAVCPRCELQRAVSQAERVLANPAALSLHAGMTRFLSDAQEFGTKAILTFTHIQEVT